jgi:anaerobic selenocysteine-containing dehydrogenase
MQPQRSTCPYDCPDACGLVVETDGERVRSVRGDPEHAYTRGSLCPKVNGYEKTVHAPGRVLTPLLRTGPKGQGQFRRASWDEAVALIAQRWQAVIRDHGREALLPFTYAGTMGLVQRNAQQPLFHRLGASLLDRSICTPAQDAGWKAVMGATPGPDPDDAAHSDLIVLWGVNALATNIHFLGPLKAARKRGAKVVLIDTHRQATAAQVDQVLLVRPGSDAALALGVLHVLARDGRINRAFVEANVAGFNALEHDVLPRFTPHTVATLTGLRAEDVEALAEQYGRARAPFIRVGGGISRYGNGALTTRALLSLPAATGAWATRGGGLLTSTGTAAAFDLSSLERADLLPGPTRTVNMNRLGHALTELGEPRVMALYVANSNPAAVCPDQNAVLRGLGRDDLFTVVHERFLTDTARYADVVLPAPTMLETADLYRSYGQFYIQRTKPVIPPLGESKSNWETVQQLAHALGFTDDVFQKSADEHIDALLDAPSPWREGLDRAVLDEGLPVALRPPRDRWLTTSGKIELHSPTLDPALPDHRPTHADRDVAGPPLRLQTAPSLYRLNSSFTERADLASKMGPQSVRLSPADAAARGLHDGQRVIAFNALGEVHFVLEITADVPAGVAVAEGVHSLQAGNVRTVNALTSQRLTDLGGGSTFYDNRIDVRAA